MIRIVLLISFLLSAVSASAQEARYSIPIENSPAYGTENSPITIIEFLDYQ